MLYQEFLRLSGSTREECSLEAYARIIEPAYMQNDLLFPDKEAVVEHWRRFGLLGFSKKMTDTLSSAVLSIREALRYATRPKGSMEEFANFIAGKVGAR
ncbi:MAG: hypothetical protein HDQ91_05605 [Desulfovibrio sp.]|nr:hypothetical protein [Desulfovibrio sp.]